jgi:hypothetical protein
VEFDLLMSADMIVDDVASTTRGLVDAIGLLEPRPSWSHGRVATFARIHPSPLVAPTVLEIVSFEAALGDACLEQRFESQRGRPARSHATVVTTPDLESLVEMLRTKGIRHREDPPNEQLPFPRIWLGIANDGMPYDPAVDGGLMIEIIETSSLRYPAELGGEARTAEFPDGSLVRIIDRGYLVNDLDSAQVALERSLGMVADGPVIDVVEEGYKSLSFEFAVPGSARLQLLAPTSAHSRVGRFFGTWGAGPHFIRIAVSGLHTWLENLQRRGVPHRVIEGGLLPERVLVDSERTFGTPFEFVEAGV